MSGTVPDTEQTDVNMTAQDHTCLPLKTENDHVQKQNPGVDNVMTSWPECYDEIKQGCRMEGTLVGWARDMREVALDKVVREDPL